MISNIKQAVDKYFNDNWIETPIQFETADFSYPDSKKWISIKYIPYDRVLYGMDGDTGRKTTSTTVVIRCFDTTSTLAYDLAILVQAFFECETIDSLKVGLGIGDGNSAVDLENGCFQVTLNFDTINYE